MLVLSGSFRSSKAPYLEKLSASCKVLLLNVSLGNTVCSSSTLYDFKS